MLPERIERECCLIGAKRILEDTVKRQYQFSCKQLNRALTYGERMRVRVIGWWVVGHGSVGVKETVFLDVVSAMKRLLGEVSI